MKVGVIPFRLKKDRFEICLIKSRTKPKQMTFPKGMVKRREAWEDAALRELFEEAGCRGNILMRRMPLLLSPRKMPEESCVFFWCEIDEVLKSWPEKKQRERIWHTIGADMDFRLTRNARKIYRELLDLGLDQDNPKVVTAENWLRQRLDGHGSRGRLSA
ncbi:MAG: NUDIX domain-containing protein [Candidatus Puniceispirillales bacterium]